MTGKNSHRPFAMAFSQLLTSSAARQLSGTVTYAMASEPIESDLPLPDEVTRTAVQYQEDAKPVFMGHYWLKGTRPELLRRNITRVN